MFNRWMIGLAACTSVLWLCVGGMPVAARQTAATIRVLDDRSGQPIPGATAELRHPGPRTAEPLFSARSDSEGLFQIQTQTPGVMSLAAPGYATSRLGWPITSTEATPTLRLVRSAGLRVIVEDAETGALLDASVSVTLHRRGNPTDYSLRTQDGVADFSGLPVAPGSVVVRADGFAPATRAIQINGEGAANVALFSLRRAGLVEGTVLDGDSRPVSGAVVSVMYPPSLPDGRFLSSLVGGRIVTGADGRFWVRGIIPDIEFALLVRKGRLAARPLRSRVAGGQQLTDLTLRIE